MSSGRGRAVDIDTLAEFDAYAAAGATSMAGWHVRSLDLSERSDAVLGLDAVGSLFLGCTFASGVDGRLRDRGALVFPVVPGVPVDVYRGSLYTPQELYDGLATGGYPATPDARIYAWSEQSRSVDLSLAKALHDHAIDEALRELRGGRRLVGVMGGHATARGTVGYVEAAHLGRQLARAGLVVSTGGGPGAMEAANLGAYLARYELTDVDEAVTMLATVPSFAGEVGAWATAAFAVLDRWPEASPSLGVPTWHYGHEPPNPFATDIAKYFTNAIREDVLLHVCTAGVVFLPGAAGTVQEIFQDACENYYADPATVAPMVLVGVEHWTRVVPAWPLLTSLAGSRSMARAVHLVDDVEDVATCLAEHAS